MLQKENQALRLKNQTVPIPEPLNVKAVTPNASLFTSDESINWLNLDEAYQVAVKRGYQSSKDAFRKLISRKPDEVRSQFGIVHEPARAGKGGNYKPYRDFTH